MSLSNSLSFRLNLALLIIAILMVGAVGSLAMVHLRVEIEETAARMRQKERKIAELERSDRFLDARIAHLRQPRELLGLMVQHKLTLRPSRPEQVVHVHPSRHDHPGRRHDDGLMAGRNAGAGADADASDSSLSLNLAVLEQRPRTARSQP